MSRYHCSCQFAADDADEFGDHIRLAFARDDDIGADGQLHADLAGGNDRTPGSPQHACACSFASDDTLEFDDHLLIAFVTPDSVGADGKRHVPVDTSTPDHWYVRNPAGDG